MIPVISGLIAGNFLYEVWLADVPNWGQAFRTSLFQIIAIAAYVYFTRK